jgi:hypothetical protein
VAREAASLTLEKLEELNKVTEALAKEPKTSYTVRELIIEGYEGIEKALQRHSYRVVAERISESLKITLSEGTLKKYVSDARKDKNKDDEIGKSKARISKKRSQVNEKSSEKSNNLEAKQIEQVTHIEPETKTPPKSKKQTNKKQKIEPQEDPVKTPSILQKSHSDEETLELFDINK